VRPRREAPRREDARRDDRSRGRQDDRRSRWQNDEPPSKPGEWNGPIRSSWAFRRWIDFGREGGVKLPSRRKTMGRT
jgi:hypothetical protein